MTRWWRSWPRGVPLLFLNNLLMSLGFYALIPYLSVYVTKSLGWPAWAAGALLMVRQVSQQGLTLLTGVVADRLGYRRIITAGFLLRGLGFALFGASGAPAMMFTAAVISGLGGALFEPVSAAALTALTPESDRRRTYAVSKVVGNLGMVLSALVGAVLIGVDFRVLSWTCGLIFASMGVLTRWRLPEIRVQLQPIPLRRMMVAVLADRPFVRLVLANSGYFFMYMQLYLTIPVRVTDLTHRTQAVSLVFLTLAVLVAAFQYPVNALVSRIPPAPAMMAGLLAMALGLVGIGTAGHLSLFLPGFVLFAVGVMITEPANYDLTAQLAKPGLTATYFGFGYVALALGGGLGQGVGGWLMDAGSSLGVPSLLWWTAAAIGGASALLLNSPAIRRPQTG
ncbi:MFS transporter [Alicyclobacillus sp.]|uniref:MDR family MFS transporter n=1 Tax=Alicyclobacillus sp. TaxID=61169 RepID=UPI0025C5AC5C|nr:MFS transporter [Alicyclobacillus sp.]MCL6517534.1 MFS transporter [Alicyclobacillus sp.]